jgi:hypothetical protein
MIVRVFLGQTTRSDGSCIVLAQVTISSPNQMSREHRLYAHVTCGCSITEISPLGQTCYIVDNYFPGSFAMAYCLAKRWNKEICVICESYEYVLFPMAVSCRHCRHAAIHSRPVNYSFTKE